MTRHAPTILPALVLAIGAALACSDAPADAVGATANDGGADVSVVPPIVDAGGVGPVVDGGDAGPRPAGMDARPANTTCRAPARPPVAAGGEIDLASAFPNMDFAGTAIGVVRSRLGGSGPLRWFVVERTGSIWTFVSPQASKDGLAADELTPTETAELFFTIAPVPLAGVASEGGLLGVAFDPEFGLRDDARFIYVHYTTKSQNEVARYRIGGGPGAFSTIGAPDRILTIPSGGSSHWGGDLKFGPDGYLYVSLGDGGGGMSAADVQKLSWPRGKILRIDPRSVTTGYAIPPGNPFVGGSQCDDASVVTLEARVDPCPEVYAYGFRNPWRMTFDREMGRLWVGDVGTSKEEVDLVLPGKNYGWPICDGIIGCAPSAASAMTAPVAQYREAMPAAAIAGGFVYRGTALGTALQGAYVFSDVYLQQLWAIDQPYAHVAAPFGIADTYEHPDSTQYPALPKFRRLAKVGPLSLVSFAEDENAELYAVTFGGGKGNGVWKLVPTAPALPDTLPSLLSETGCADPLDPKQPSAGMIPYDVVAPSWADGAASARWLAIPDGTTIGVGVDGDLDLPNESVTRQDLRVSGKLVETRLLVRHSDGGWAGYGYVWNDAETEATKASPAGEARTAGAQVWRAPSRGRCLGCHTPDAGGTLGLEIRQLDRDLQYPATGRTANQLDTLAQIGMFTASPRSEPPLAAFAPPFGTGPLEARARTYLHARCSGCHRGASRPSLQFNRPMDQTELCTAPALLVPGSPGTSRLATILREPDETSRMPKNGAAVIDAEGASLVESWIASGAACP